MICTMCRFSSVSQRAIYLTRGDLGLHELQTEKSAEAIVVSSNELRQIGEVSQTSEGQNIK